MDCTPPINRERIIRFKMVWYSVIDKKLPITANSLTSPAPNPFIIKSGNKRMIVKIVPSMDTGKIRTPFVRI